MTTQPSITHATVAPPTTNRLTSPKSQSIRSQSVTASQVKTPSPSSKSQAQAAEINISTEGATRSKSITHPAVHTPEAARALVKDIAENIKRDPEKTLSVHSNLRLMRVNQLIFD